MRIIKFRVWDKLRKRWARPYDIIVNPIKGFTTGEEDDEGSIIFMQYVGKNDKNNKEIFEGDFIKKDNEIRLVMWYPEKCKFVDAIIEFVEKENEHLKIVDKGCSPIETNEWHVVGNIYENPELIKK